MMLEKIRLASPAHLPKMQPVVSRGLPHLGRTPGWAFCFELLGTLRAWVTDRKRLEQRRNLPP